MGLKSKYVLEARKEYKELYSKALPYAGEPGLDDIEIADFGLSSDISGFREIGLGIMTIVNYSRDVNGITIGHTGKVLMSLPGQFMPEHKHSDVSVLEICECEGLVRDSVKEFKGIKNYDYDGSEKGIKFSDEDYAIVFGKKEDSVHYIEGKSETFKMIFGGGILWSDDAVVLRNCTDVDAKIPEHVTSKRALQLKEGSEVLLPKGTKHAFLAGGLGAVFFEFSTPSIDEADVFTDLRVIR
ncbi:hypothetical protein HQ545_03465 [Candidatus Woesearchaeota archaeon]|nr:hypothetical protein [Candidatus Woesearchaeota archaeon]